MHPGEAPGLGVDIDESFATKWPYERAYLPVNRKLDGTVHSIWALRVILRKRSLRPKDLSGITVNNARPGGER
jgi:hypothetical protein